MQSTSMKHSGYNWHVENITRGITYLVFWVWNLNRISAAQTNAIYISVQASAAYCHMIISTQQSHMIISWHDLTASQVEIFCYSYSVMIRVMWVKRCWNFLSWLQYSLIKSTFHVYHVGNLFIRLWLYNKNQRFLSSVLIWWLLFPSHCVCWFRCLKLRNPAITNIN